MQFKYGQWALEAANEMKETYTIVNPGSDGERRFYMVTAGKFGQPIIVAEPDLSFAAPTCFKYVNAKGEATQPTEKIAGIICRDGIRTSLSGAKMKGVAISINADGSVQVGEEVWHLATLFQKDKNRIINYDAYLVREPRKVVRILELGDLDLF